MRACVRMRLFLVLCGTPSISDVVLAFVCVYLHAYMSLRVNVLVLVSPCVRARACLWTLEAVDTSLIRLC